MQIAGNISVYGNLTNSDFTSNDIFVSKQLNSSYKMNSDSLKYNNGYIDDLYTDVIEGFDVKKYYFHFLLLFKGSLTIEGDLYLSSFVSDTVEATSFIVEGNKKLIIFFDF